MSLKLFLIQDRLYRGRQGLQRHVHTTVPQSFVDIWNPEDQASV